MPRTKIVAVAILAASLLLLTVPGGVLATATQQAKLTASDAAAFDAFGGAVAVDGETAVVGAQGNDGAGAGSGAAYVFVRSGSTWSQQAKLTAAASSDSVVSHDSATTVTVVTHPPVVPGVTSIGLLILAGMLALALLWSFGRRPAIAARLG